ncbi:hypothetical protein [Streptomyces cyaneofuscatus]|uniref:hypothetical protein n=1 Tax=Streptomyces cyaneofuscatus TaxID=66883 RepID=UPI003651CA84
MTATLVEIHVPVLPTPDLPDGSSPYPWIDQVEDFLVDLEGEGGVQVHDEGEEYEDAYVCADHHRRSGRGRGAGRPARGRLGESGAAAARRGRGCRVRRGEDQGPAEAARQGNGSPHQGEGQAVTRKRSVVESPAYVVLLATSALWTAASSGSPVYLRVLGGVFGTFCVVAPAVDFVKERRRKRAAADL